MAQVIRIKKNYIPIPFVDDDGEVKFELRFSMTDESINRLYEQYEKLDKLVKEIEESVDDDDYKNGKVVLKHAMDGTIGEGTFDKIYDDCQSLIITLEYYAEIVLVIADQLKKTKVKDLEDELQSEYFGE